ncbi:FAD:protein FMN transferase [Algibacillus agarilyticus]|uniref:FAD:protein FMN transferase n=1 Tax=Algibacillus agarilyticus TaxID=2234133 RepID=UPI000DCFF7FA|nr:FAD:protein FMN transferase [Algibacillus agarilyticus]
MIRANLRILYLSFILFCSFNFTVYANWVTYDFNVMGTAAHVEIYLDNPANKEQLINLVVDEMVRIDHLMSPYKATSEISLLNRSAHKDYTAVSLELFELFQTAHKISQLSRGAFDITFASVGYQYDYRNSVKPSQQQIADNIAAINFKNIKYKTLNQIYFTQPNTKVDLGGIAKGYAVKTSLRLLEKAGVKHAMVSAGGDTGLLGDRQGRPWLVAVKHPRNELKQAVKLPLQNEAISTSGDYERFFIKDGIRYHHILNPKTGRSAQAVISVSVIGPDPTYTDALSTTLFVKGLNEGLDFINKLPDYEAIIIDKQLTMHFSNGLKTH